MTNSRKFARWLIACSLMTVTAIAVIDAKTAEARDISRFVYSFNLGEAGRECGRNMQQGPTPGSVMWDCEKDGRELVIEFQVTSDYLLRKTNIPRASLNDSKSWQRMVVGFENKALSKRPPKGGKVIRSELLGRAGPIIADAKACIRYRYDIEYIGKYVDNEGIRCLFYDQKSDVLDMVVIQYEEIRNKEPRHPNFSKEAEELAMTLKQVPK